MTFASPSAVLDRVFRKVFQHRPPMTVDAWADANRVLTARDSAEPGRWSTARVPYLREVMRAYSDPEVYSIRMRFAAQCGKTQCQFNMLMYTIDRDPMPSMLVLPNDRLAGSVNVDRLMPSLRETPAVARHLTGRKWDEKTMQVRFDTMDLYLTGANSSANLSSRPIGRLFADEIKDYPRVMRGRGATQGNALDKVRKRLSAWPDRKEVLSSTPGEEGSDIDAEYATSDQGIYHVPCPHCGAYQALRFGVGEDQPGGVRWTGGVGEDLDDEDHAILIDRVRISAWYECEACHKRIVDANKPAMLSAGQWVRIGQEIDAAGIVTGEPAVVGARGFWISQIYSPFRTFGDVAAEFVRRRGSLDRDFVNEVLGEPWREPGDRADAEDVMRMAATSTSSGYERGTVPADVLMLTAAIDVQKDHCYLEIVGWGEGERRWLIDWAKIPCPEVGSETVDTETGEVVADDNWIRVEMALRKTFPRVGAQVPEDVPIAFGCIDIGHRTGEVYQFCRKMGPNLTPVRAFSDQIQPWKVARIDRMPDGKSMPGGLALLEISIDYYANEVFTRMRTAPPARRSWAWPGIDHTGIGEFRAYARQLSSEERVTTTTKRGFRQTWQLKPGRKDNHYLDTARYGLALADFRGLRQWTRQSVAASKAGTLRPALTRMTVGGR